MGSETKPGIIKKISIDQLQPGMYIHDLDCDWLEHDFLTSRFAVRDEKTVRKVREMGLREVYIDTSRGSDVADARTEAEVRQEISARLESIAQEDEPCKSAELADEIARARHLHKAASRIARDLMADVRLGRQIEMERVEPLVEGMIDSIFRNQDALLPLARLKSHDGYTFQHSVSVCALMIAFARGLKLPRDNIREIAIGSLLHDVGKARVPDAILNKPARLTEAEFTKMKSHVVQSIIILQHTPGISQTALDVAGQHHERYDGTGYPNRLRGHEIAFHGQMSAIVDVYDAISSDRVYHKGMLPTDALGKLLEWSRFHFNPELVQVYIKSIGIYPTGSLVRLESDRLGVVIEQHPGNSLHPVVRVFYHADRRHYLEPEDLDLARPLCQDRIVGHEAYEAWGIDPKKWLPA